ncbi:hypothetical protein [Curtobacterium sp. MCBD17_040]|uniref:hypothetical protein n=1 Tax=Curtobacterium sp. MCBD17_040 TaxID=2175674 RepID=UPI000DAA2D08|nr:hypothetical protein [Curtobacterium sp. MCBD17_040]WIB65929.1 hypothetical protein DEI94_17590 [Curtobacterium sp. MCBD17_040]
MTDRLDQRTTRRLEDLRAAWRLTPHGLSVIQGLLQEAGDRQPGIFFGEYDGIRLEWHRDHRHTTVEVSADDTISAYHFDFNDAAAADLQTHSATEAAAFLPGRVFRRQGSTP